MAALFFSNSFVLFLGYYGGASATYLFNCLILFIVMSILIAIFIYVQKVNKIRKTFLKAVKKGYPELYNEYEDRLNEYVD